jgi:hypothetical protein
MGRASRNDVTPRTSEGMRSNFNPPPALRARIRRFGEVGFLFALLPAVRRRVLGRIDASASCGSATVSTGRERTGFGRRSGRSSRALCAWSI